MKKTLLISWTVYPSRTASSVLVKNIASAFSKDELVVIGEGTDIEPAEPWGENLPRLIHLRGFSIPSKKGIRYSRWLSFRRLREEIEDVVRAEGCECVMAVFPDELWMYLGYSVSKRLNIPFYSWFHNTYLDNRTGPLRLLAERLQPRFFEHARTNFVISDGMRRELSQIYPEVRFETLLHGFDIPRSTAAEIRPVQRVVRFFFSGAVHSSCWDACERLFRHILDRPNSELYISSGNTAFVKKMCLSGRNLFVQPYVAFEEFNKRLGDYDIMLLPHGFDGLRSTTEYRTIFPTRAIPLLYSNRPILAHSPPGSFLTEYLLEHDCAEVVSTKSSQDIESAIRVLLDDEDRVRTIVRNANAAAKQFDIAKLAAQLRERIGK